MGYGTDIATFLAEADLSDYPFLWEIPEQNYVEQPDGMRHTVNRAFFVMVAVDEDQKPIQVPELIITTEAEKARNEAAKMRRDMRRQRRENGF